MSTTPSSHPSAPIDQQRLDALAERFIEDMAGAMSAAIALLGDKLGLYRALRAAGSLTPAQLAERTGLSERMVREWLINQAAGGYVEYDHQAEDDRYYLSPEQAHLLADPDSDRFLQGGFQFATAMVKAEEHIERAFRDGKGFLWGDHHPDLHAGVARFFDPVYAHQLVDGWMQRVEGLAERLERGASVADVGCGYGYSTVVMAARFPNSRFWGFDYHAPSVERGNALALERGLADRVRFEACQAHDFPDRQYDVVTIFNCLHDVGRYDETARHIHSVLRDDGMLFMMEPMGGDRVPDNFNPVGRLMSGSSVLCCTPHGVASGGDGLGTVVTDARLRQILLDAGFRSLERVGQTRYNRLFFGRP
ncbi:methyltransferase domain-containing protein [Paraliomyxa miuraensis]|uniref:methyltransferase domain-containing protein n=1 Tax=Paraliomyxa miuraensis TaxID=376150 RepID=UPI002254882D|nr:methyltransferase domain-containing protein [Paraliomyxa miuraensis]MCX4239982.1 methyltransferase domain-containing protein [Paraliomyxa miuraensis]